MADQSCQPQALPPGHVVQIGPGLQTHANLQTELTRGDVRDGRAVGLGPHVVYHDPGPNHPDHWKDPEQCNLDGHASCNAMSRAVAPHVDAAWFGVVPHTDDRTGEVVTHGFIVKDALPGQETIRVGADGRALSRLPADRIHDEAVVRGMNGGVPLPESAYQGAVLSRYWPEGVEDLSHVHMPADARLAEGNAYQGAPRLHVPTTAAGRAASEVAHYAARAVTPPAGHVPRPLEELYAAGRDADALLAHVPGWQTSEGMIRELGRGLETVARGSLPVALPGEPPPTAAHREAAQKMIGVINAIGEARGDAAVLADAAARVASAHPATAAGDAVRASIAEADALLPGVVPHVLRAAVAPPPAAPAPAPSFAQPIASLAGPSPAPAGPALEDEDEDVPLLRPGGFSSALSDRNGAGSAAVALYEALSRIHVGHPFDGRRPPDPRMGAPSAAAASPAGHASLGPSSSPAPSHFGPPASAPASPAAASLGPSPSPAGHAPISAPSSPAAPPSFGGAASPPSISGVHPGLHLFGPPAGSPTPTPAGGSPVNSPAHPLGPSPAAPHGGASPGSPASPHPAYPPGHPAAAAAAAPTPWRGRDNPWRGQDGRAWWRGAGGVWYVDGVVVDVAEVPVDVVEQVSVEAPVVEEVETSEPVGTATPEYVVEERLVGGERRRVRRLHRRPEHWWWPEWLFGPHLHVAQRERPRGPWWRPEWIFGPWRPRRVERVERVEDVRMVGASSPALDPPMGWVPAGRDWQVAEPGLRIAVDAYRYDPFARQRLERGDKIQGHGLAEVLAVLGVRPPAHAGRPSEVVEVEQAPERHPATQRRPVVEEVEVRPEARAYAPAQHYAQAPAYGYAGQGYGGYAQHHAPAHYAPTHYAAPGRSYDSAGHETALSWERRHGQPLPQKGPAGWYELMGAQHAGRMAGLPEAGPGPATLDKDGDGPRIGPGDFRAPPVWDDEDGPALPAPPAGPVGGGSGYGAGASSAGFGAAPMHEVPPAAPPGG